MIRVLVTNTAEELRQTVISDIMQRLDAILQQRTYGNYDNDTKKHYDIKEALLEDMLNFWVTMEIKFKLLKDRSI